MVLDMWRQTMILTVFVIGCGGSAGEPLFGESGDGGGGGGGVVSVASASSAASASSSSGGHVECVDESSCTATRSCGRPVCVDYKCAIVNEALGTECTGPDGYGHIAPGICGTDDGPMSFRCIVCCVIGDPNPCNLHWDQMSASCIK